MKKSPVQNYDKFLNITLQIFSPILQFEEKKQNWNEIEPLSINSDAGPASTRSPLLIQPDQKKSSQASNNFSWKYKLSLLLCGGIGVYSGWLFWNTSKTAAEIIDEQLSFMGDTLSAAISELTKYCGVATSSLLNTQIMILLLNMFSDSLYRTSDEKFLTGNLKFNSWLISCVTAVGAALPLISLNITTADNQSDKIIAYFAAAASIPPYWFGSQFLLSTLFPRQFSKTIDDSENKFSVAEKKLLQNARSILSYNLCNKIPNVLLEYSQAKTKTLEKIKKRIENLVKVNSIQTLTSLISFLLSNPLEEKIVKSNLFCHIGKGTASIGVTIVSLALVVNDVVTAYYTGTDLVNSSRGKILLGTLAAILTGIANTGFSLLSLKTIFRKIWYTDLNLISTINPKTFTALITVVIFVGLFSGGAGALEGYSQVGQLLIDIGFDKLSPWLPELFEVMGFVGAAVVNIPYCLDWAQWLLGIYAEKFGDSTTKTLIQFSAGCYKLADTINNTKIIAIKELITCGVFGSAPQLESLGVAKELMICSYS
jgi:hypothetical protein